MRVFSFLFVLALVDPIFAQPAAKAPEAALAVIKPERGFIDDAFALSASGSTLFYVHTDGANWAVLRAMGLPIALGKAAPTEPSAAVPTPAATSPNYPSLRLGASESQPGKAVAKGQKLPAPPQAAGAAPQNAAAFDLAPGQSAEVLTGLPLSITKVVLLPEDRVLLVMRDLDIGGVVNGSIYSLRSRSLVPLVGENGGSIGPVTDITLGESATGPVIVAASRPQAQQNEYSVKIWNAATLKLVGAHSYRPRDGEGRVPTAQGNGIPLFFCDDYQSLVVRHDGVYDKKMDVRQPDFLGFLDALTGKLRRSQPISDPAMLQEMTRVRKEHSASVFPHVDGETQKLELFVCSDRLPRNSAVSTLSRSELKLARPTSYYDAQTLQHQALWRPSAGTLSKKELLFFSWTVDPVNQQAVAQRRTDADDIDFYVLDPYPTGQTELAPIRLHTLPGQKRPSTWVVSSQGRLALLRKHKNFPRGGTEIEVYDLPVSATSAWTAN